MKIVIVKGTGVEGLKACAEFFNRAGVTYQVLFHNTPEGEALWKRIPVDRGYVSANRVVVLDGAGNVVYNTLVLSDDKLSEVLMYFGESRLLSRDHPEVPVRHRDDRQRSQVLRD